MWRRNNSEYDGSRKRGIKKLTKLIKNNDNHFTLLPDFPQERCSVLPEKIHAEVSMKWVRRRPINVGRRHRAVLDKGFLELTPKKAKKEVGLVNEHRIDLSKVTLLADQKRVVLKFQVESLCLIPQGMPVDDFKEHIHRHRLYRQEQVAREENHPSDPAGESARGNGEKTATDDFHTWDNETEQLKVIESIKDMQSMCLSILEQSTKNLLEQAKILDEMKRLLRIAKDQTSNGNGVSTALATEKSEQEDSNSQGSEADSEDEDLTPREVSELLKKSSKPGIHFSFESTRKLNKKIAKEVIDNSRKVLRKKSPKKEIPVPTPTTPTQVVTPTSRAKTETQSNATNSCCTTTSPAPTTASLGTPSASAVESEPTLDTKAKENKTVAVVQQKIRRREILPAQQCISNGIGLKALYQLLITKTGMPLDNYEPLSALQFHCEELIWSSLLDTAAMAKSAEDRMCLITAFAMSAYSNVVGRHRKPFNPVLGETFEYEENGWKYHAEQVSHHPPISALHAQGKQWIWWCTVNYDAQISKLTKTADLYCDQPVRVRLLSNNEEYTWNRVRTKIENITAVAEQRKISHDGLMMVKCSNGYTGRLFFKRGKAPSDITGDIIAPNEKVCYRLFGSWDKQLNRQRTTGQNENVIDFSQVQRFQNYYGFTKFSMGLNEPADGYPPSDSRNRLDMRALEYGQVEKATTYKQALEMKQRNKTPPLPFPVWFEQQSDEFTNRKMYFSNKKYWKAKETGFKNVKCIETACQN